MSAKRRDTGGEFSGFRPRPAKALARPPETPTEMVLPSSCPGDQTANPEFANSIRRFAGHAHSVRQL